MKNDPSKFHPPHQQKQLKNKHEYLLNELHQHNHQQPQHPRQYSNTESPYTGSPYHSHAQSRTCGTAQSLTRPLREPYDQRQDSSRLQGELNNDNRLDSVRPAYEYRDDPQQHLYQQQPQQHLSDILRNQRRVIESGFEEQQSNAQTMFSRHEHGVGEVGDTYGSRSPIPSQQDQVRHASSGSVASNGSQQNVSNMSYMPVQNQTHVNIPESAEQQLTIDKKTQQQYVKQPPSPHHQTQFEQHNTQQSSHHHTQFELHHRQQPQERGMLPTPSHPGIEICSTSDMPRVYALNNQQQMKLRTAYENQKECKSKALPSSEHGGGSARSDNNRNSYTVSPQYSVEGMQTKYEGTETFVRSTLSNPPTLRTLTPGNSQKQHHQAIAQSAVVAKQNQQLQEMRKDIANAVGSVGLGANVNENSNTNTNSTVTVNMNVNNHLQTQGQPQIYDSPQQMTQTPPKHQQQRQPQGGKIGDMPLQQQLSHPQGTIAQAQVCQIQQQAQVYNKTFGQQPQQPQQQTTTKQISWGATQRQQRQGRPYEVRKTEDRFEGHQSIKDYQARQAQLLSAHFEQQQIEQHQARQHQNQTFLLSQQQQLQRQHQDYQDGDVSGDDNGNGKLSGPTYTHTGVNTNMTVSINNEAPQFQSGRGIMGVGQGGRTLELPNSMPTMRVGDGGGTGDIYYSNQKHQRSQHTQNLMPSRLQMYANEEDGGITNNSSSPSNRNSGTMECQNDNRGVVRYNSKEARTATSIIHRQMRDMTPTTSSRTFTVHMTVSELDPICTLGTGSFGRVLLCRYKRSEAIPYIALKIMGKAKIVSSRQIEHVRNERALLAVAKHPFCVSLYAAFQDSLNVYLALEYVRGGELFRFMQKQQRLPSNVARFYAIEVFLVIDFLHSNHIIYRDLKPENILLSIDGHIKLTDFGFAKYVPDRTWTLCGTPEYLAPEIILSKGHGKSVDWWAFGVLIYEMLVGNTPFVMDSPMKIYEKVLSGNIPNSPMLSECERDLISHLLVGDLTLRYGCRQRGPSEIKDHPWFAGVQWDAFLYRAVTPPYFPAVSGPSDSSNFGKFADQSLPCNLEKPDTYGHLFPGFTSDNSSQF
eukprot:CFRG2028T1